MVAHNKKIKDFTIEGEVADDKFIFGHREKMEKVLDDNMRDSGYVPHLDLDTNYRISYNIEKGTYEFSITGYAVYVGKKRSWEIVGLSGSKYIYK